MSTLPPEGEENAVPQQPGEHPGATAETPAAPPTPEAPAAPQYDAPQQPAYGAPAPGYGAPPQQGYGAPQQPGYGAPQQGYPQGVPAADPLSNLTLNYWLSVFFIWVPALIFYIIEKDKGNAHIRALHAANLNFSLLRTGVLIVGWILFIIPLIGPLLAGAANLVLFIFHIMAAAKVTQTYQAGGGDPFIFNVQMVK